MMLSESIIPSSFRNKIASSALPTHCPEVSSYGEDKMFGSKLLVPLQSLNVISALLCPMISEFTDLRVSEEFQSVAFIILVDDHNVLFLWLLGTSSNWLPIFGPSSSELSCLPCCPAKMLLESSCVFCTLDSESALPPGDMIFFFWFLGVGKARQDHNLHNGDVY